MSSKKKSLFKEFCIEYTAGTPFFGGGCVFPIRKITGDSKYKEKAKKDKNLWDDGDFNLNIS